MIEWVGDGICDDATNILECQYDGGDCCLEEPVTNVCYYCTCLESTTTTEVSKVPIIITYYNGTHTIEMEYDFEDPPTTTTTSPTKKSTFESSEKYQMNSTFELKQTTPPSKIEQAENYEKSNGYSLQSYFGFCFTFAQFCLLYKQKLTRIL